MADPAGAVTRLWVLNPNTTRSMTDAVLAALRPGLPPGVSLAGITAAQGPEVIDSPATFAAAAESVVALALQHLPPLGGTRDVVMLACFGDPGLEALRRALRPRPVAGLAQAAVAEAVRRRLRFAILTSGPAWEPMLRQRVRDFGAAPWLTGVHALAVNGKALAQDPARHRPALQQLVRQAEAGGAQALLLGGAAFAGLGSLVDTQLPVIDPLQAAAAALLGVTCP